MSKDTYQGQGFSGKRMGDPAPQVITPTEPDASHQVSTRKGLAPALLNGLFLAALAAFIVVGIFLMGGPNKALDEAKQAAGLDNQPQVEVGIPAPTVIPPAAPAVVAVTPAPSVAPEPVAAQYTGATAPTASCWHGYWSQDMKQVSRSVPVDAYGEPVGPNNPYPAVRSVVIPAWESADTWTCIGPENCGYLDSLRSGKDGTLYCLAGSRVFPTLDWAGQAP